MIIGNFHPGRMENYMRDPLISMCFQAGNSDSKNVLQKISAEEIRKISNLNNIWTKRQEMLKDHQLSVRERFIFTAIIGDGAQKIHQIKIQLIKDKIQLIQKKFEILNTELRAKKGFHEVEIDQEKLLEVPDIELKFPEMIDQHLLSESENERFLHLEEQSQGSLDYDLEKMMHEFELFCENQKSDHLVPEIDIGNRNLEPENSPPQAEIAETILTSVEGTPTKRPGSVVRGDDTPSKRRKLPSMINEFSQRSEAPVEEGIEQIQFDQQEQQTEKETEPEPEQLLEEINKKPILLRRKKKGILFDSQTQLSHKWMKNFSLRTNSYTRPRVLEELRAGTQQKRDRAELLLRRPTFAIQSKSLRQMFEQFFKNVVHTRERNLPIETEELELRSEDLEIREEIRTEANEEANLMISNQYQESEFNLHENETVVGREKMGRMSIIPNVLQSSSVRSTSLLKLPDVTNQEEFQQDFIEERFEESQSEITENSIFQLILDRLAFENREMVNLKEIIPVEKHNKTTATIAFKIILELQMQKKILLSKSGKNQPIYVKLY